MATPKEKLVKSQALTAKKKRFFRILQSSNCSEHCSNVNNQVKAELEKQMKLLIEQQKSNLIIQQDATLLKDDLPHNDTTGQASKRKKTKRQLEKSDKRKAFKCVDLLYGLNQAFKAIKDKDACMIWLNRGLAANMVNVVHKLCTINRIFCFGFDLSNLMKMLNISSLTIITFRASVKKDESLFNSIYQFLLKSPPALKEENQHKDSALPAHDNCKAVQSSKTAHLPFPIDFNYYYSNNESNTYTEVMRERLKQGESMKKEFQMQLSYVAISEERPHHFPDYESQRVTDYQFEVVIGEKRTREQSIKSANQLTEKLFGLDRFENANSKLQFQSPILIKGQVEMEKSKLKRTNRKVNKKKKI